jgi:hypothetical protein
MPKKVQPYGSAVETESAARGRSRSGGGPGKELVSDLASVLTVREIAAHAAEAIRVLNELTADNGGDLTGPDEARDVITSLELMGQGLPQLCEQLARFLVTQREDGQVKHEDGRDLDFMLVELTESLTAAGQAADMLTAALDQAREAVADLRPAR